jgi:hypothetical protein
MERTGKVNQFLEWYNILPPVMQKTKLQKFVSEIYQLITGSDNPDVSEYDLENLEWKVRSLNKINAVESAYLSCLMFLHLVVQFDYNLKKFKLTRGQRRKIKEVDFKLLQKSIEKIEIFTGIQIKDQNDLAAVQTELIWLKDKYNENFNKKNEAETTEQKKKMSILEYAGSFALYAGTSFVSISEMTIPEFIAMRTNAENKYQSEKAMYDKMNNKNMQDE